MMALMKKKMSTVHVRTCGRRGTHARIHEVPALKNTSRVIVISLMMLRISIITHSIVIIVATGAAVLAVLEAERRIHLANTLLAYTS